MAKAKVQFECQSGYVSPKYLGRCPIADNGIRWWKRLFKILLIVVLE